VLCGFDMIVLVFDIVNVECMIMGRFGGLYGFDIVNDCIV